MAKKVVSVAIHAKKKKNPIKIIGKSKKLEQVLKIFINYMKSDTYMFAPLISSRSSSPTAHPNSFGGQLCFEEMEKTNLGGSVDEYLKSNCYMFTPLASPTASPLKGHECGQKVDINSNGNEKEPRVEELNRQAMNRCREIENEEISNSTNGVVVKHSLLQRETVKRVVHQNHQAPGTADKKKRTDV